MNQTTKPFTDIRVRKALTLGLERYTASRVLSPLASLKDVGALMRPATEFAMSESELQKRPGFGRDMEKNRAEARRLLAEAGYPNGFKVVLKNRNVRVPYIDFGVFVIQEWKKIGIEAEHRPLETATWFADGRDRGNFELMIQPAGAFIDDPDQLLNPYVTGSPQNWGRFANPGLADLYARQARVLDPAETPGIATPFSFLYALHDALIKPLPGNDMAPCLAESWRESPDGLAYEFKLREGLKFHNGDPFTAADVKFSFQRYRGTSAKLLHDRVKSVDVLDPHRIRFVLPKPWQAFHV